MKLNQVFFRRNILSQEPTGVLHPYYICKAITKSQKRLKESQTDRPRTFMSRIRQVIKQTLNLTL